MGKAGGHGGRRVVHVNDSSDDTIPASHGPDVRTVAREATAAAKIPLLFMGRSCNGEEHPGQSKGQGKADIGQAMFLTSSIGGDHLDGTIPRTHRQEAEHLLGLMSHCLEAVSRDRDHRRRECSRPPTPRMPRLMSISEVGSGQVTVADIILSEPILMVAPVSVSNPLMKSLLLANAVNVSVPEPGIKSRNPTMKMFTSPGGGGEMEDIPATSWSRPSPKRLRSGGAV